MACLISLDGIYPNVNGDGDSLPETEGYFGACERPGEEVYCARLMGQRVVFVGGPPPPIWQSGPCVSLRTGRFFYPLWRIMNPIGFPLKGSPSAIIGSRAS